jgi:hypothetical protein
VALALVVAARFGVLLGLSVWMGVALATLLLTPMLLARLEKAQADELAAAAFRRVDRLLTCAMVLLAFALGSRVVLDRLVPPGTVLAPLAAMALSRLVAALVIGPAHRALVPRLRDANAPASEAERRAFGRLRSAWLLLLTLEACLGLYALYAVS